MQLQVSSLYLKSHVNSNKTEQSNADMKKRSAVSYSMYDDPYQGLSEVFVGRVVNNPKLEGYLNDELLLSIPHRHVTL